MIAESAVQELSRRLAELTELEHTVPAASLRRTAELAATSVPGCRCAALSVFDGREPGWLVASHPEAAALSEAQHCDGNGPVLEAARTGEAVYVPDTSRQGRWPAFRATALRLGVRCSATLALGRADGVAAFALYATRPHALTPHQVSLAALLGEHAAVTYRNSVAHDNGRVALRQAQERARSRPVIEQAKALVMRSLGCDEQAAFDELSRISQQSQVKLSEVARRLVNRAAGASGRARPAGATAASGHCPDETSTAGR